MTKSEFINMITEYYRAKSYPEPSTECLAHLWEYLHSDEEIEPLPGYCSPFYAYLHETGFDVVPINDN